MTMSGMSTRQRIVTVRAITARQVELTLSCSHVVIRHGRDIRSGSTTAFCGHCAKEWTEKMLRQIDARP